jgi:uncharacterized membrane-anchored protein
MNAVESLFLDAAGVFGLIVGLLIAMIDKGLTIGAIIYLSRRYVPHKLFIIFARALTPSNTELPLK